MCVELNPVNVLLIKAYQSVSEEKEMIISILSKKVRGFFLFFLMNTW